MKRIIKEGKVKTYQIICPNCGCEFTFNPSDVEDNNGLDVVICPQDGCESIVYLNNTL